MSDAITRLKTVAVAVGLKDALAKLDDCADGELKIRIDTMRDQIDRIAGTNSPEKIGEMLSEIRSEIQKTLPDSAPKVAAAKPKIGLC